MFVIVGIAVGLLGLVFPRPMLRSIVDGLLSLFVRLLQATGVALAIGVAASILLSDQMPDGGATAIGLLAAVVAGPLFLFRMLTRDWRKGASLEIADEPDLEAWDEPCEPEADKALTSAWQSAMTMAPPSERSRLRGARALCAELLFAVDGGELAMDLAAIEHAVLIRRQVPSLVETTGRAMRGAPEADRNLKLRRMIDHLAGFGRVAQDVLAQAGHSADDDLAVLDAHLTNRLRR